MQIRRNQLLKHLSLVNRKPDLTSAFPEESRCAADLEKLGGGHVRQDVTFPDGFRQFEYKAFGVGFRLYLLLGFN